MKYSFLLITFLFINWNCLEDNKYSETKSKNIASSIEDSSCMKFVKTSVWDNGQWAGDVIVGLIIEDKTNKVKCASVTNINQSGNNAEITSADVEVQDKDLYIRAASIPIQRSVLKKQFAESKTEVLLRQQSNGSFNVIVEDAKMSDTKRTGININRDKGNIKQPIIINN